MGKSALQSKSPFNEMTNNAAAIYAHIARHPESAETMIQFAQESVGLELNIARKTGFRQASTAGWDRLRRLLEATLQQPMLEHVKLLLANEPEGIGETWLVLGSYATLDGPHEYGLMAPENPKFFTKYQVNSNYLEAHDMWGHTQCHVSPTRYDWELRQAFASRIKQPIRT